MELETFYTILIIIGATLFGVLVFYKIIKAVVSFLYWAVVATWESITAAFLVPPMPRRDKPKSLPKTKKENTWAEEYKKYPAWAMEDPPEWDDLSEPVVELLRGNAWLENVLPEGWADLPTDQKELIVKTEFLKRKEKPAPLDRTADLEIRNLR